MTTRHLRPRSLVAIAATLALLVLGGATEARAQAVKEKGRWISLFNGKNLDGWTPKFAGYDVNVNHANTFRVENGVIKVSYDKYQSFKGEFGHLFYKQKFSDYRLRVEYRFVGEQCPGGPTWGLRNSGVMIHSQSPESMGKDQNFPVSIEAQFLGGTGQGERTTGNLCTPGTHVVMDGKLFTPHCVNSRSKTYDGEQWVTMELEVHGNSTIKHFVNGDLVIEYSQPQLDDTDPDAKKLIIGGEKMLREGYIALQAESHPLEIRKVEIFLPEK